MPETGTEEAPAVQPVQAGALLGPDAEMVRGVVAARDAGDDEALRRILSPMGPAEVADLVEMLHGAQRAAIAERLADLFDPPVLAELDETVRTEVAERLGADLVARAIVALDSDDARALIATLGEGQRRRVLQAVPLELRRLLEEGLAFPEDSAGRLMQREFVAVPSFWTVGEVIDFLRESEGLPDDFYDLFVVDPRHRLIGTVALSRVLRARRPVRVLELAAPVLVTVPVGMDQEEVAYVFSKRDLVSAPVVDASDRLIGVITIDDVVDVIHEEAAEDIMRLGGVREDDLYHAAFNTGRARFSWLFFNLLTAIGASIVIGFFEGTIGQLVILAVLMPIAASMGGNAGTQTLTVAVRAIAMKELTVANALRMLSKEALVGAFNGALFAVIVGAVAWTWSGSAGVGAVMAAAMVVTMMVAGLAGLAIPLGLSRTRFDPAVASGGFLTTVTDVTAFLAFLGLGAWFLL